MVTFTIAACRFEKLLHFCSAWIALFFKREIAAAAARVQNNLNHRMHAATMARIYPPLSRRLPREKRRMEEEVTATSTPDANGRRMCLICAGPSVFVLRFALSSNASTQTQI